MEPIDYLRVLRRRSVLLLACVMIAAAAGWATGGSISTETNPEFVAGHTIIRDVRSGEVPASLPTVGLYIRAGDVPRRVAARLDFEGNPVLLARNVGVEFDEVVGTLEMTATASSRPAAVELANAFGEETIAYLSEQASTARQEELDRLGARIAQLQVEIDDLQDQIDLLPEESTDAALLEAQRDAKLRQYGAALDQQQAALDRPSPTAGYATLEAASPDLARVKAVGGFNAPRSRPVRAALGAVLGLLLGVGVVLIVERVDPRLNTRPATEDAFNLPVVAEVPHHAPSGGYPFEIRTLTAPASGVAEAYRSLRAWLMLMPRQVLNDGLARRRNGDDARVDPGGEPTVVLVTSPGPGDGKSTTVANLAVAFAETGRRVLVLGCDFRRPIIHAYFGADARPGLSHLIEGQDDIRTLHDIVQPTSIGHVGIAPHGSGLTNLGDVAGFAPLIVAEARQLADIVLVDSTPLLAATDVLEFIPCVDAVVLVCRSGSTTSEAASRSRELLSRLGAHVVGITLIRTARQEHPYGYYGEPEAATHKRRWRPWARRSAKSPERLYPEPRHAGNGGKRSSRLLRRRERARR